MTEEMPLDLRSLGDVESPEVVREALHQFRRRAVRSSVWVVIVVVAIVAFALGVRARRTLGDQISDAPGVRPGTTYRVEGMTAVLIKVADLGDRTGIHLLVAQPGTGPQHSTGRDVYELVFPEGIRVSQASPYMRDRVYDLYFDAIVPRDGRIRIDMHLSCAPQEQLSLEGPRYAGGCRSRTPLRVPIGSFVIDLEGLGVPPQIWKKGGST